MYLYSWQQNKRKDIVYGECVFAGVYSTHALI